MAILKALIPIFLHMIFCALICLGDFGLWLILAVAKKHGAVEYNVEGTAKSTYEIKVGRVAKHTVKPRITGCQKIYKFHLVMPI